MNGNRLISSFRYAIDGLIDVWKHEQNFRIHTAVTICMLILGMIFSLSAFEWIFLILAIAGVLSMELMNTAIERCVDLITTEHHPLAKRAKDAAAAAVFSFACLAIVIGCVIFVPKIYALFF